MARRKIRLPYITNESQRKTSIKKIKNGVFKKPNELNSLCNIEAATIMYNSFEQELVIRLSIEGMQQMVTRFKSLVNVAQTQRMANQEGVIQERIQNLSTQLLKLKKDNREKEMSALCI